mmetsp:Transcript_9465/g.21076  ORF Transcript_9465/g.21076 Transcript_9465/m.21076 type:complete len:81 (-) Transcript_9465:46-288(-)
MWRWHDDGALLFGEWWVCGMQRRAMLWRGCRWRRMIFSLRMCVILLCVRRCILVNKLMKVNATTIVVSVGVKSDGTLCEV